MDQISCITAAENAFHRTGEMLFRPFRWHYWLLLGLGAWLTLLGENSTPIYTFTDSSERITPTMLQNAFHHAINGNWNQVLPSLDISLSLPMLACLFCFGIIALLFWWLAVAWLKAQGHLLYLEQIVNPEVSVKASVKQHLRQGNSAFLWKLTVYILSGILVGVAFLLPLVMLEQWIKNCVAQATILWPSDLAICGLVLSCCGSLTIILLTWVIMFYFYQFVVPLMYLGNLNAFPASRLFLKMLMAHPLPFAKFLLLVMALKISLAVAIVLSLSVVILITCCLALLPLAVIYVLLLLPYVWAVTLLPILLFFRLCGLELLNQMQQQHFFELPPKNTAPRPAPEVPPTTCA